MILHVDFFIAGVQKGGTTALDAMLRRHPTIQMASRKEPHFFDNEAISWASPDYDLFHQFFDWTAKDVIRGEATPIYSYWPNAIERLHRYNPGAKLIVGLRHPAHRAFSHWRMETTRKGENLSFARAIREGRERVQTAPGGVHRVYSYVERGFYSAQAARILSIFPESQVLFFRTDLLWRQPDTTLAQICSFLGLNHAPLEQSREYVGPLRSADLGSIDPADRAELLRQFETDISETSALSGVSLDDWLDQDYAEPMPNA